MCIASWGRVEAQTRLEVAATRGLTPLVGRERDVEVLLERWDAGRRGQGTGGGAQWRGGDWQIPAAPGPQRPGGRRYPHQVRVPQFAVLSKYCPVSRDRAVGAGLGFYQRRYPSHAKLAKMERALSQYRLELAEVVPLLVALLALPLSDDRYAPLTLSSQHQRQKTLDTLLAMVVALAEQQPLLFIVEDLHWIDPSTLEWLTLLIDQTPTSRLCLLLTCRPTFQLPWGNRSYLTQLTLNRLTQPQTAQMIEQISGGKALPAEVIRHLVEKADGVPLYIEEMTKAILESGLLQDVNGRYELAGSFSSLAIPATLQDSLMARLDRLGPAKGVAQVGATIGRQFAYELLQAVSPLDEETLQRELGRLVDAELVYQTRHTATGYLPVQACADPGRSVSIAAQEHTAAVPPAHCAGVGGTVSRDGRDAARAVSASLHGSRAPRTGRGLLAAGWPAEQYSARRIWKRSAISPRGWSCSRRCQTPPNAPGKSSTCRLPAAKH